jgi:hypothetical protein
MNTDLKTMFRRSANDPISDDLCRQFSGFFNR